MSTVDESVETAGGLAVAGRGWGLGRAGVRMRCDRYGVCFSRVENVLGLDGGDGCKRY